MTHNGITDVFSLAEIVLWAAATRLVSRLDRERDLRCQELTRALATVLDLSFVVDGHFGEVEHSWIELPRSAGYPYPTILDVDAIGRLPRVQLVQHREQAYPYRRSANVPDVRQANVERLVELLRG